MGNTASVPKFDTSLTHVSQTVAGCVNLVMH